MDRHMVETHNYVDERLNKANAILNSINTIYVWNEQDRSVIFIQYKHDIQ